MKEKSKVKSGDSSEQQKAEEEILRLVSKQLGKSLEKRRIESEGSWMEVDGASADNKILCEVWAHIGKPKSGQKHKIMSDALKLLYLQKRLGKRSRKVLVFADNDAASEFEGQSWRAACLKAFDIEVLAVKVRKQLRSRIEAAQKRQYR